MKKLLITVNDKRYEVEVEILEDDESVYVPKPVPVLNAVKQEEKIQHPHTKVSGDVKVIVAPLTGLVLEVKVKVGQSVKKNEIIIILEAMKMHVNILASEDGTVAEISVKEKETVSQNTVMIRFE